MAVIKIFIVTLWHEALINNSIFKKSRGFSAGNNLL
jgi:hypothetical protein